MASVTEDVGKFALATILVALLAFALLAWLESFATGDDNSVSAWLKNIFSGNSGAADAAAAPGGQAPLPSWQQGPLAVQPNELGSPIENMLNFLFVKPWQYMIGATQEQQPAPAAPAGASTVGESASEYIPPVDQWLQADSFNFQSVGAQ